MIVIYLLSTLLIAFFLIRNLIASSHYRQRAEKAVLVFDDLRPIHKVSRMIFGVLLIGMSVLLIYYVVTVRPLDVLALSILVCLVLCFALFSIVPYSAARWLVLTDGVYLYNYDRFIPFSEMIACRIYVQKKKSYLQLDLLRTEADRLKRSTYMLMIPADKAADTHAMIRDFIQIEDRAREKRRRQRLSQ